MILDRLEPWTERCNPRYGQVVLAVLLICGTGYITYFVGHPGGTHPKGARSGPATIFSWLPDGVLLDGRMSAIAGVVYLVGAVLWWRAYLVPWSALLTAGAFLAATSLYLENASQTTHVAHLTAMLLLVYALWYQFCFREIRQAKRKKQLGNSLVYPRWVHGLSVFSVGVFYGWSGLSKIIQSGLNWPNGISLQLWVSLWGDPNAIGTQLILANLRLAVLLQVMVLVGELGAIPAIFFPRLRPWIGLLLIAFHLGQIEVFGWGFHANAILIALVFLPVERWMDGAFQRGKGPVDGKEILIKYRGD
jgi:hypothetical protein